MHSVRETNYYLNTALFVAGLVCLLTGLIHGGHGSVSVLGSAVSLRWLHTAAGYVLGGLVALHLLLHARWIGAATRALLRQRGKLVLFLLVIAVTLAGLYLLAQGLSPSGPYGLGPGGRGFGGPPDR
ncbi:MAG: hypothetical protein QHH27_10965 [Clostridia bacterium]|jgi:hypothetical protein|nr:hypothetical protein [Clostridia bacterium]MDH7574043.1 hypothetical protein [Clostridia bacterium]